MMSFFAWMKTKMAAFSLPIIIGKKFEKFREVKQLVKLGGVISINDQKTFNVKLSELIIKDEKRKHFGEINYNFIKNNVGASSKVINHLKKIK